MRVEDLNIQHISFNDHIVTMFPAVATLDGSVYTSCSDDGYTPGAEVMNWLKCPTELSLAGREDIVYFWIASHEVCVFSKEGSIIDFPLAKRAAKDVAFDIRMWSGVAMQHHRVFGFKAMDTYVGATRIAKDDYHSLASGLTPLRDLLGARTADAFGYLEKAVDVVQ